MTKTIKLFAAARSLAGHDSVTVELPEPATVGDLRRTLAERFPALAGLLRHSLFSVDTEYAHDGTAILAGSEVACIPPVSGG